MGSEMKLYHLICFPRESLDINDPAFMDVRALRGTFTGRERLIKLLTEEQDPYSICEGYYEYALIETHDADCIDGCNWAEDGSELWFKYNIEKEQYEQIERPESLRGLVCFA